MFPPLTLETVRWRPLEGEGLEHLTGRAVNDGLRAESTVIGENETQPHGIHVYVDTDLAGSTSATTLPNRHPCLAIGSSSPLSTIAHVPFDTFTAERPVGAEGFVTDYPTLFARL